MKNYSKLIFLIAIVSSGYILAQIGTTIPKERIVDWTTVGYHNDPSDNLPNYVDSVIVPKPSNNPNLNYTNITKKIKEATKKKGLTAVILRNGIYKISKSINIGIAQNNIVLKGSGNTEILFLGQPTKASNIIRIIGKPSNWKSSIKIINYNDKTNTIKTHKNVGNIKAGDYIEIRVPNGSWHDSQHHKGWNPQNYLGTIIKVVKLNKKKNELTLDNSLKTLWSLSQKNKLKPSFVKFTPVREIGIESLKLSTDNKNNRQGFNINFAYAANCWVKNIESENAASAHVNIGNSVSIEIRNSVFHHAKDYGNPAVPAKKLIAGTGYGINIARSSNCLIENNVFYHLRHAMIIALGSDRNVFGYNYSFDQYSFPVKKLADLNLHGHFPFDNLFEGNIVERIHADQWWGSNGPNNTFVRNLATDGTITLEKTNNANLLGNEAKGIFVDSKNEFEFYANVKTTTFLLFLTKKTYILKDISYYRDKKPKFIKNKITWPPIGPNIKEDISTSNTIPAKVQMEK